MAIGRSGGCCTDHLLRHSRVINQVVLICVSVDRIQVCLHEDGLVSEACEYPMTDQNSLLYLALPQQSLQDNFESQFKFWLDPSSFVKDIVLSGYRIPFLCYPDPIFLHNHVSTLEKKDFVAGKILRSL